jgi:hypothetical protein
MRYKFKLLAFANLKGFSLFLYTKTALGSFTDSSNKGEQLIPHSKM